jgi:hypothetical protein
MERAVWSETAGGQAALDAWCATDRGTLQRVLAELRGQLGGRVISAAPVLIGPTEQLEHRTCTLLGPVHAKGRQ